MVYEEILVELFENIGLPFPDKIEQPDFSALHRAVEYGKNEEALAACLVLIDQMKPVSNQAVHDLTYRGLKIVEDYFTNGYPCEESEIWAILDNRDLVDLRLLDILMMIFGRYCTRRSYERRGEIKEICLTSDFLPCLISKLTVLNNQEKIFEAYELVNKLDSMIQKDNVLIKLDFLSQKARLFSMMNVDASALYQEIEQMLEKETIPDRKRVQIAGNLSMRYIVQKQYEESLKMIRSIFEFSGYHQLALAVHGLFCCSQLNLPPLPIFKQIDVEQFYDRKDIRMFRYFDFEKRTLKRRNEMALRIVEKELDLNDSIYLYILEEEIKKNCKAMKGSAALIQFGEILEKKRALGR